MLNCSVYWKLKYTILLGKYSDKHLCFSIKLGRKIDFKLQYSSDFVPGHKRN